MTYKQFFKMFVWEDDTAYEEGYRARSFGFTPKDCPYSKTGAYYYPWVNGWKDAGQTNLNQ